MKRLFILIVAWLAVGTLSAQNLTRCKYWFDQNYSTAQEATLGNSTLQFQIDATTLSKGVHCLNLHIQDAAGVWSSPRSFLFLHVPSIASAPAIYKYWFDDNTADAQNVTLTNGTLMLNASSLPVGMHTLTLQCMVARTSAWSNTCSIRCQSLRSVPPSPSTTVSTAVISRPLTSTRKEALYP